MYICIYIFIQNLQYMFILTHSESRSKNPKCGQRETSKEWREGNFRGEEK